MPPKASEKKTRKSSTSTLQKEKDKQVSNRASGDVSADEADNEGETATFGVSGSGRRTSQVSIADPPFSDGEHPDELRARPTPRGRKSDQADNATLSSAAAAAAASAKLPAPGDDIFKSLFWPSLPYGTTSLESQVTHAKLDMMMAYLQDIRSSQVVTTKAVSRATSRASSTTSAKAPSLSTGRSARLPVEYAKFEIPSDEIDNMRVEAEARTKTDDEFTQRAVRLHVMDSPTDCSYTVNVKGCQEAGLRFRDKILELGVNFSKADRDRIGRWVLKDAGMFFLQCMKERRRIWERENASDEDENQDDQTIQKSNTPAADESLFIRSDEDSSEPVREQTGGKSNAKLTRSGSRKKAKLPTIADDSDDVEAETIPAAADSSSRTLSIRGTRQSSATRGSSAGRGKGRGTSN